MINRRALCMTALLFAAPLAIAQGSRSVSGDHGVALRMAYERAMRFAPWRAEKAVRGTAVTWRWIGRGDHLWYVADDVKGQPAEIVIVDSRSGHVTARVALASFTDWVATQTGVGAGWSAQLRAKPAFDATGRTLALTSRGTLWSCSLPSRQCVAVRKRDPQEVESPDGKFAAFVQDHNVWLRDLASGAVQPLTRDGREGSAYGGLTHQIAGISLGLPLPEQLPVRVAWSPDSRRLVVAQVDESQVPAFPFVEQVPRDRVLPRVLPYRYDFLADGPRIREQLWLLDVEAGKQHRIDVPLQHIITDSSVALKRVWWRADGKELAVAVMDPEERWVDVYKVDAASGSARRLFREEESYRIRLTSLETQLAPSVYLLSNGDLLWYSHRSGSGHLYIIDGETGKARRDLTRAVPIVHGLLHVDERAGLVYFAAGGAKPPRNPYYGSIFRLRLDGTQLRRLTPEGAHHDVRAPSLEFRLSTGADLGFAADGVAFVETESTPWQPEVTRLRRSDGAVVREIGRARLAEEITAGYVPPEEFTVPAPEGEEPLFGLIFFPSVFDASRTYPVIDAIYNGQQTVETPRTLTAAVTSGAQAVAELGFIVVVLDARGTPQRSRSFHDFAAIRRDQVGSIGDHVHALRQLATTRRYMDLERVGIYGVSNGGYATLRAMLAFPEFFKVGVSINGSHDLRKYIPHGGINWVQRQGGTSLDDALRPVANQEAVAALRGNLLLMAGGMDANAPISNTLAVAQGLIDAGKNFDFVLVPRMGHSYQGTPFAVRKMWDFFVRHLLDEDPPDVTVE